MSKNFNLGNRKQK